MWHPGEKLSSQGSGAQMLGTPERAEQEQTTGAEER